MKTVIASPETGPGQVERSYRVHVSHDMAQEIDSLAAKRKIKTSVLIREILKQYIAGQTMTAEQTSVAFLLSLAGMFDSGISDTSENVRAIVRNAILQKTGFHI